MKKTKKNVSKSSPVAPLEQQIQLRMKRIDVSGDQSAEEFTSPPFNRGNDATMTIKYQESYSIECTNTLLDRLMFMPLQIEVVHVLQDSDESIPKLFGMASIDLSSLVEGEICVNGFMPLILTNTHDVSTEIYVTVTLSRDLRTERQWEESKRGEMKVTSLSGVPFRWYGVSQQKMDVEQSKDSELECAPRRVVVEMQWPFSLHRETFESAPISGDNCAKLNSLRQLYVSEGGADDLEAKKSIEVVVRLEVEEIDEQIKEKKFVADPIFAVGEFSLLPLLEAECTNTCVDVQLNISDESITFLQHQHRQEIEASKLQEQNKAKKTEKATKRDKGNSPELIEPTGDDAEQHEILPPVESIFASSVLHVEFSFSRPLRTSTRPKSFEPTDIFPISVASVDVAEQPAPEELFRKQLCSALHVIGEQYNDTLQNIDPESHERIRKEVVYRLNKSGHYFAFKERLKVAIACIAQHDVRADNERNLENKNVSTMYIKLAHEAAKVFNHEFARGEVNKTKQLPIVSSSSARSISSRAAEARMLLDHDEEKRLLAQDTGLLLINLLVRQGFLSQACDLLHKFICEHSDQLAVRRRYALMLTALDANNSDAFLLLRYAADSPSAEELDIVTRAVALRMSGQQRLSKYVLRRAEGNLDAFIDYALEYCVPEAVICAVNWQREFDTGDNEKASLLLARAYALKGNWSEVLIEGEHALQTNPQNAIALLLLGEALWHLGERKKAAQNWELMLMLRSQEPSRLELATCCGRLGEWYSDEGNLKGAVNAFILATSYEQSWPSLWRRLGKSLVGCERFSDAVDALAEANLLDNTDAVVWGMLAIACAHLDRFEESRESWCVAKRLVLSEKDIWHQLINVMVSKKRFDEAAIIAKTIEDCELIEAVQEKKTQQIIDKKHQIQ